MAEQVRKLCGGNYKNLSLHVINKHKISMEDYETTEGMEEMELTDDETGEIKSGDVSHKEILENIHSIKSIKDKTIGEWLEENKLTEKELYDIVKNYRTGAPINTTQMIKKTMEAAESKAEDLVGQDIIEVTSVSVAEVLIKKHGYIHKETKSKPVKTWILKRKGS